MAAAQDREPARPRAYVGVQVPLTRAQIGAGIDYNSRSFGLIGSPSMFHWFDPIEIRAGALLGTRWHVGVRISGGLQWSKSDNEMEPYRVARLGFRPEMRYVFRPHARLQPTFGASLGIVSFWTGVDKYYGHIHAWTLGGDLSGGVQWLFVPRVSLDFALALAYYQGLRKFPLDGDDHRQMTLYQGSVALLSGLTIRI